MQTILARQTKNARFHWLTRPKLLPLVRPSLALSLLLALLLAPPDRAEAATINAISVSRLDVGNAVAAAANGDTVVIPAGTATWTTGLTLTKAITLQGAGIGQTIIKDGITTYGPYLMNWSLVANQNSRMTGIEFQDDGGYVGASHRLRFSGTSIDSRRLRIDHCKFASLSGPIFVFFTCLGVVDHNIIIGRVTGQPAFIGHVINSSWGRAQDTTAWGDGAYAEGDNFGTDKFLFFENNAVTNLYTTGLTALDGHSGARYVWRYNVMERGSLEIHGSEAARARSGRAYEVYLNTFLGNDTRTSPAYMRGGVGLIWSNTIIGWTAEAVFSLLDGRSLDPDFAPIYGADGRNPWDKNNAGNPFVTGTCSSAGALTMTDSGKSWTANQWAGYMLRKTSGVTVSSLTRSGSTCSATATAHGFSTGNQVSIFGANQYGYNGTFAVTVTDADHFTFSMAIGTPVSPATGTIKATAKSGFALINSNTGTQITFQPSIYGSGLTCVFSPGDTYEINKVDQTMDQNGVIGGSDLGGLDYPALPGAGNNQTVSPWYEWGNTREGGADVDFSTGYRGGSYAVIVSGIHYHNNTVKPGYTPYAYPHPLVSGASMSGAPSPPSGLHTVASP